MRYKDRRDTDTEGQSFVADQKCILIKNLETIFTLFKNNYE